MRSLSVRRRRIVALAVLPACCSGALGPIHQHFAGRPHQGLFMSLYFGALFLPLAFAVRELFKLRQEGSCERT